MRFLITIYLILAAIALTRCNPAKKAHAYAESNPNEFAQYCADHFPVMDTVISNDSIHFDTLYIEGEPKIETSYLTDTVFTTVYYPGTTRFVTKTVYHTDSIIRRDFAQEKALQVKIDNLIFNNKDLIGERDKFRGKFNWWRIACLITWAAIVVFAVGKIYLGKFLKFLK